MKYNVQNINEIPFMQCKVAEIYPSVEGKHVGTLKAGCSEYTVSIVNEPEELLPRVWAQVFLGRVPEHRINDWALEVADRSKTDPEWKPIATDLRDGDVSYTVTYTYNYPDDNAMDTFLADAKRFLEEHAEIIDAELIKQ